MYDLLKNSAFSWMELTDSINEVPNDYGKLQDMGLFRRTGLRTRAVAIEINQGTLNLLPTRPPGGTSTLGTLAKPKLRTFTVPHIPHDDQVLAEDVVGVLATASLRGDSSALKSVQELLNEKLETMRAKHDITLEFHRWGALSGIILDADGSVLLNLWTEFGITEPVFDWELDNASASLESKALSLKTYMEKNARGTIFRGIHVFASETWFRQFMAHPSIKEYRTQYRDTQNSQLGVDYRNSFSYMGITFEEYSGEAVDIDGNVRKFIADGTARVIPLGSNIFRTYDAPASTINTVNKPGQPIFASQMMLDHGVGIHVHTESNPLSIVLVPRLIPQLTI